MRLIYISLGWIAGIVLAAGVPALSIVAWLALAFLATITVGLAWERPGYRIAMLAVLAFALGGWRFSLVPTTSDVAALNDTGGLTIEGVIVGEPDIRDEQVQVQVDAQTVTFAGQTRPTSGLVLVQAPRTINVHYGDRIAATGLLITPAEYDTFSYADYLARSGVFSIMRNAAVTIIDGGHGNRLFAALLDLKASAAQAIANHLPEPDAALLTGILLGSERGISPGVADAFSKVGASHVIAISGFNMVIISGVVMSLLSKVFKKHRWLAAIIGITVIGVYTVFVGANPAVVRAAIMSSLLVAAPMLKRKTFVPSSLAFVALLMTLQNPTVLWDVSFQLSFSATLGLTLFVEPLSLRFNNFLQRIFPYAFAQTVGDYLSDPLIVTLAAQITTLPLIVLYFGRLSLLSIVVNLLIIPAQTPLLIIGALATMLVFVTPGFAQVLYWIDLVFLSWTIGVVRAFAALPFADVEFVVDPRLVALFFLVLIGGAMMQATQPRWWLALGRFVRQRTVVVAALLSGIAVVILIGAVFLSRPDGRLHVWMLDIDHNNAVLMQTPGGAQILVDGGRYPSRLLTALGDHMPFTDREIEVLVITQPDEYDTSALVAVLERYDVGVILVSGQPNLSDAYQDLEAAFAGHEVVAVRAGYTINFDDDARLEVLYPQERPSLNNAMNDEAVTLRAVYGDISFLLTSDLSRDGQLALLESGQWPVASVMQLPQHGTTASLDGDFLQVVQPQVVVLQSDRANRRGDPDADVLAMLGDTPLFRTDEGGTIHLWTDGHELWVGQGA